jgi:hypothetical protein
MKSIFALLIVCALAQQACDAPVPLGLDAGDYTYTLCDFELKNTVVSFGGPTALTVVYPGNFSVTARCPEKAMFDGNGAPINFLHFAEFECVGNDTLKIDLYIPRVHLRDTGAVINLIINDLQPWNITL